MSLTHEAVCDGCGKRAKAIGADTNPDDIRLAYDSYGHPGDWYLLVRARDVGTFGAKFQGYCSRDCVPLAKWRDATNQ